MAVLTVTRTNGKKFRVTAPEGAKITFGPWSPPSEGSKPYGASEKALSGTLRIYESTKSGASILGCFSGVASFRTDALDFEEEVITQEIATLWKSDRRGFKREETATVTSSFEDDPEQLGPGDEGYE